MSRWLSAGELGQQRDRIEGHGTMWGFDNGVPPHGLHFT